MTQPPPSDGRTFVTPISRSDLFDPGQVFRRDELLRRVLSVFWLNCCSAPELSRAPAPVVELSSDSAGAGVMPPRVRAWWLLHDGIVEESEGPYSERLALFFGRNGAIGQLWPRYEFRVAEEPVAVEMSFHQEPGLCWSASVGLDVLSDGLVRVAGREPKRRE